MRMLPLYVYIQKAAYGLLKADVWAAVIFKIQYFVRLLR